jgi:hypothetical protein
MKKRKERCRIPTIIPNHGRALIEDREKFHARTLVRTFGCVHTNDANKGTSDGENGSPRERDFRARARVPFENAQSRQHRS